LAKPQNGCVSISGADKVYVSSPNACLTRKTKEMAGAAGRLAYENVLRRRRQALQNIYKGTS
jgi:hypothetical protein